MSICVSLKHIDLLADRIIQLQAFGQELPHALLSFLDLKFSQHERGKWAHSQVLSKSPILRKVLVDVVRQFSGEDDKRALTLSHLLKHFHELFIFSNIRVDWYSFTPLFYPILETTDTLESSTRLVGVRESQYSSQLCVPIIRHFVALAEPLCELNGIVIICTSPIFSSGLDHSSPPPRVDIEVIKAAGNPLWMSVARSHG